jgi:hypothetical protein
MGKAPFPCVVEKGFLPKGVSSENECRSFFIEDCEGKSSLKRKQSFSSLGEVKPQRDFRVVLALEWMPQTGELFFPEFRVGDVAIQNNSCAMRFFPHNQRLVYLRVGDCQPLDTQLHPLQLEGFCGVGSTCS